jgi:hypothetical protein
MSSYESNIKNYHVQFLVAIEQHCLVTSQENSYDIQIAYDASLQLHNLRMLAHEPVPEWYQRCFTAMAVYKKITEKPILFHNQLLAAQNI